MKWVFAKNDGGRDSGFNDAGIETFRGNFDRYLARELLQNSLDARLDPNRPVHVRFEVIELLKDAVPDFATLEATFASCREYWRHDPKALAFFARAEELSQRTRITALRVRDFNTTGVPGGDAERAKNWYSLVRCAGSSSKGGGEGGSFGIGKNAPFAASRFRTVLYSTCNGNSEHAFQGVATLVSHQLPDGSTAQPTGFLGGDHGESIRTKDEIPEMFRRDERGLDVVALGYNAEPSWEDDLVYSVLENFWPAVDLGDLEVTVGDKAINRETLPGLLEAFSGHQDFTAHLYYRAFKQPTTPFHHELPNLKKVSLYLYAGDADLSKRVAMVRKTGMVVFPKLFRSVLPFCGVFVCRNDEGNKLLREMEPPRHDTWDPDHPEKGANKKVESEYIGFIRECIRQLVPADDSKEIAVPGLNRFLPDDDETPEEAFDEANEGSPEETPDRKPLLEKIEGKTIDPKRRSMQPDESKPEEGEEDTEDGTGEGTGGGPGDKENDSKGGSGGGGGGKGDGDSGTAKGSKGGAHSKPSIPIHYRTFSTNVDAGVYTLAVASQKRESATAHVAVFVVGDDQRVPAEIKKARFASGEDILIAEPGVLGPLKLRKTEPLRIEIVLEEPLRVAMEVSAHEA